MALRRIATDVTAYQRQELVSNGRHHVDRKYDQIGHTTLHICSAAGLVTQGNLHLLATKAKHEKGTGTKRPEPPRSSTMMQVV